MWYPLCITCSWKNLLCYFARWAADPPALFFRSQCWSGCCPAGWVCRWGARVIRRRRGFWCRIRADSGARAVQPGITGLHSAVRIGENRHGVVGMMLTSAANSSACSVDLPFHSQDWSISNFPCSLTRNITPHGMKNVAVHSALRWKMIMLLIVTTSLTHCSLGRLGECIFWTWEWKGWGSSLSAQSRPLCTAVGRLDVQAAISPRGIAIDRWRKGGKTGTNLDLCPCCGLARHQSGST